jgi:hypothetical protein
MSTPTPIRNYLFKGALIALSLFILIYTLFAFRYLIEGPRMSLSTPENGASLNNPLISVEATIENASHVYLNGRKVFTDLRGNLKEELLLSTGTNVMRLRAEDRFGRSVTEEVIVTVEEPRAAALETPILQGI